VGSLRSTVIKTRGGFCCNLGIEGLFWCDGKKGRSGALLEVCQVSWIATHYPLIYLCDEVLCTSYS
jgi:hypothetical protein